MIILFIGPPGCGKGTQSLLFQKRKNFFIFSVGSLLRNLSLKFNFINSVVNKGGLIDPEIIFNNIDDSIFFKNIIVDGFPRNLNQALFFQKFLNERNLKIDYVFEFQISKKILIERIKNRKLCRDCLNDVSSTVCECGSKNFFFRNDDDEAVFKNRFSTYVKNKNSIFHYYEDKTQYIFINAEVETDLVFQNIVKCFNVIS